MKEEIKNFVILYNKMIGWNKDIIKSIGKKNIPDEILDNYLSTDIIDEDKYDLEHASIYKYDEKDAWAGTLELQAYSNERYTTTYFWYKENQTEEEYKSERIKIISKKMNAKIDELSEKINELTSVLRQFNKLQKFVNILNKQA